MNNPIMDMLQRKSSQQNSSPLSRANDFIASYGGDGKAAFMDLCRQNGVNMPNVNTPEEAFEVMKKQINVPNIVRNLLGGR